MATSTAKAAKRRKPGTKAAPGGQPPVSDGGDPASSGGAPVSPGRDPAREAWELLGELFIAQKGRMLSIASELELNPPQLFALQWLEEPLPMGELAGRLHCDNSNVTGIVDRLEHRGLVERRPDERDRRVKLLVLTEEGQRLRELLVGRMHEPPPTITGLSRADQRALRDIMRRAVEQR
ncbi:MAG: MarR family winged helix-turn-helix transcriptional regulator [Solirubrobacteraceae bacterium]